MSRGPTEIYEFGKFRLDVGERRLERLDGLFQRTLPEKAFRTLTHLVRNRGTLVSKNELLAAVWPDAVVEENNLGKAVHLIRHALGDDNGTLKYIETIPKHGYRFVADVKRVGVEAKANDSGHDASRVLPGRSPAYDLYIRGKVKAGSENSEDTEDAIKVLEAAVAIDPYFAAAYAQLARAYNTLSFKFASRSKAKILQENADVAITKALDLDPDLSEAHFSLGLILWTKTKGFPHEQAIKAFKKSLEFEPNTDETHHQLSMVYAHVGLLDEAHEHVAKAVDLNPNNTMARFRVGVYLAWHCRFEEALNVLKTVPSDVSPMLIHRVTAEVLVQMGRLDEAGTIVKDYLRIYSNDEGGSFTSLKALLLAKAGKDKDAEGAIKRAVEIGEDYGHFHHTAYNIASSYAAMNKPGDAVKWLEFTADNGFPNYPYFEKDPNLANIRGDQRFMEFMNKLRPQWEKFKAISYIAFEPTDCVRCG